MTKEEAVKAVMGLWQVTQLANQPAQVHIECQGLKEKILGYIEESEKRVDAEPEQE